VGNDLYFRRIRAELRSTVLKDGRPGLSIFGLGLTLYFASQGSGKVLGPVLAGTLRLALVAGTGVWLASQQTEASGYFFLMAVVMLIYGVTTAGSIRLTQWGKKDELHTSNNILDDIRQCRLEPMHDEQRNSS